MNKLLVGSGRSLTPSPAAFQFFILVSLVFLMQLIGAVLFLVHWKQVPTPSPVSPASLCHAMTVALSPPGNWGWWRDTLPLASIISATIQTAKQVGGIHGVPNSPLRELVLSRVGEEQRNRPSPGTNSTGPA